MKYTMVKRYGVVDGQFGSFTLKNIFPTKSAADYVNEF